MNTDFVSSKKASEVLGIHSNTLRTWESKGKIRSVRTEGGSRRYDISSFIKEKTNIKQPLENICYCRVSSQGQKSDLNRQVEFLKNKFPNHDIITDIGSGLNYKRKGLKTILDKAMSGTLGQVVVAYRDRLCRFGFDLIEHLIKSKGGNILVLNDINSSPQEEMVKDLTSIIHVFSCRMYGLRKYKTQIKRDNILNEKENKEMLSV